MSRKKLKKDPSEQPEDANVQWMYNPLEERQKMIEVMNTLVGMDLDELNSILDLVTPPEFKTLKFEKYDETTCLKIPLKIV